jgi:hypothetical protein
MSCSEGGMLATVDLVSVAVEVDDFAEPVELLVAIRGGQLESNGLIQCGLFLNFSQVLQGFV